MITTHTLARADTDRLHRGVAGLASGAYTITLTRDTADEVSAFVAKDDGTSYGVILTAPRAFCGCHDSMYRGQTCKHAVIVALSTMRNPTQTAPIDLALATLSPAWDTSMI